MKCEIIDHGPVRVVALGGEVDMSSSPEARRAILGVLSRSGVLVDLSQVDYIDSSGVASLVEGYQLARERRLPFGLVGVSASALMVLQLAHLHTVFPIYGSIEDALAHG